MKLYSDNQTEMCYPLKVWRNRIAKRNIQSITLTEMQVMKNSGFFWCKEFQSIGDVSEKSCGKMCELYRPRNGKNGRCKSSKSPYEPADNGNTVTLTNPNYNPDFETFNQDL